MSVIPFEQNTFEYGPRDYLHQLMTLISTLRGGQQRYLPLLVAKINDTMPQMATPGYGMPMLTRGSTLDDDFCDGNSQSTRSHGSAPNSNNSTPFGSPPLSAVVGQQPFTNFSQQLNMNLSPTTTTFPNMMTAGVQYGDMSASISMEGMFNDQMMQGYPGTSGPSKYDTGD